MDTVPFAALDLEVTSTIYTLVVKSVLHLGSAAAYLHMHYLLPSLLSQGQLLHRQDSGVFIFTSTLSNPAQY